MKNRSTGRLDGLFNVVIPECFYRGSQPLKNTTRFPIATFGNDVAREYLSGFTLIELLIVVLIIGILSAVALPQYQKAVDKSRYATLMPVATDVKNAQETFYMASAEYTDDLRNLDIQLPGTVNGNKAEFGDGVKVEVSADGTNDYVAASKDGLDNKYVMYFAQSANFPQEIHCEALTSSERAKQLCLGMGGTEVGANGAYTAYVLEGSGSGTLSGGSTGGNEGGNTGETGNTGAGTLPEQLGSISASCYDPSEDGVWCGDHAKASLSFTKDGNTLTVDYDPEGYVQGMYIEVDGNFFNIIPNFENGGYDIWAFKDGYHAQVDANGNMVFEDRYDCNHARCPAEGTKFPALNIPSEDALNRCTLAPSSEGC